MGKDKLYDARMEGIKRGYDIASTEGIDALKNYITQRGYFGVDVKLSNKEYATCMQKLAETIYNNVLTCSAYTLNHVFGWNSEQIHVFKKAYDDITDATYDWNFMAKQYVTMMDYAVYLNTEFDLGINTDLVSANEDSFMERRRFISEKEKNFQREVINMLRVNGFNDASDFLETKMGE